MILKGIRRALVFAGSALGHILCGVGYAFAVPGVLLINWLEDDVSENS